MFYLQFSCIVSFRGRTSSMCSGCRCKSMFSRRSKRYWNGGDSPLALAPFRESLNSQSLRPTTKLLFQLLFRSSKYYCVLPCEGDSIW